MKIFNKIGMIATVAAVVFNSCHKVADLPLYKKGNAVILSASKTAIAPTPADSLNNVVTFSWSNPGYATDSSTEKFILEIDSSGRNFSKEVTSIVIGAPNISFTGKQLNNILAGFGFAPGQTFSFDIRVTSSYGNNNEQLKSNVVKVTITSYLVPVTLVPSSTNALVLLVSNATSTAVSFNWNSSPYGSNNINYALQLDVAGDNFAHPQVRQLGNALTSSFTVTDLNSAAIAAGVIGGSTKNVEFRIVSYLGAGYTTPLVYSSVVTINITTFTPVPSVLFIIGDATPLGWNNNPGLSPTQQFTRIDAVSYGIVINLSASGSYLFLPEDHNLWTHKYGGTSATGGTLLADGAVPGSNTPHPSADGNYQIIVNFQTGTYTVTPYVGVLPVPTSLFIIGDATPLGWNNNSGLSPTQQFTQVSLTDFQIIVPLTATGSYLFLPEDQGLWTHKYGGTSATGGAILYDGAVPGTNTPHPSAAGNYLIDVDFAAGTYTVTKQ